jgi:hypothetical protein
MAQGWPGAPHPPAHTPAASTPWLGIVALTFGVTALMLCLVPYVGAFLGLAGVVLGVVALVQRQPRWQALTATVLAAVAVLVGGISTTAATSWFLSQDAQSWSSDWEPEPAPEIDDGTPATGPGSFDEPHDQPHIVMWGERADYSVTARLIEDDTDEIVLGWSHYNEAAPDGYRWVILETTVTGLSAYGSKPSDADGTLMIASGPDEFHYSEWITLPDDIPYLDDARTLDPSERFTGVSAYLVPADATVLRLSDGESFIAF